MMQCAVVRHLHFSMMSQCRALLLPSPRQRQQDQSWMTIEVVCYGFNMENPARMKQCHLEDYNHLWTKVFLLMAATYLSFDHQQRPKSLSGSRSHILGQDGQKTGRRCILPSTNCRTGIID